MSCPEQLPLPLPAKTALGREDYFVSPANALPVALIEGWRDWPARKFLLTGPEGAGKTHLAHVWAALSGATIVAATELHGSDIPALAGSAVCVEDADRIAGNRPGEEALFHLHNLVLAEGHALLVTARSGPARWPLGLPDLQSRLMGMQGAQLPGPDDLLLGVVLTKLLDDRGVLPDPEVLPFLTKRMPRSFAFARRLADALNARSLAAKKGVTRRMAAEVLARLDAAGPVGSFSEQDVTKPSQD